MYETPPDLFSQMGSLVEESGAAPESCRVPRADFLTVETVLSPEVGCYSV